MLRFAPRGLIPEAHRPLAGPTANAAIAHAILRRPLSRPGQPSGRLLAAVPRCSTAGLNYLRMATLTRGRRAFALPPPPPYLSPDRFPNPARPAMHLTGLHHLTAITADAPGNLRFYTGSCSGCGW